MAKYVYFADGSFTFPEYRNRVTIKGCAQGGGGGLATEATNGGGGAAGESSISFSIYKKSGVDTIYIYVDNSGGGPEEDGGDVWIEYDGVEVFRCRGGKGANGAARGDNYALDPLRGHGGSGGNGYPGAPIAAGGGGAIGSYPSNLGGDYHGIGHGGNGQNGGHPGLEYGEDATTFTGANGIPYGTFHNIGNGGHGQYSGDLAIEPEPSLDYVHGGRGKIVLDADSGVGRTRHSSGCCCSVCDLAPMFPKSVTLAWGHDNDGPPSGYDFGEQVNGQGPYGWTEMIPDVCDPTGNIIHEDIYYPDSGYPQEIYDNAWGAAMPGINGIIMEMLTFEAGPSGIVVDGVPKQGHMCKATYAPAVVDPSVDDGNGGGYVFSGHPATGGRWGRLSTDAPHQTVNSGFLHAGNCLGSGIYPPPKEPCFLYCDSYYWIRRAPDVWCGGSAELTLMRLITGEYYASLQGTVGPVAGKRRAGGWGECNYDTTGNGEEVPTMDGWGLEYWPVGQSPFFGATYLIGVPWIAGNDGTTGSGGSPPWFGPFDSPSGALTAVQGLWPMLAGGGLQPTYLKGLYTSKEWHTSGPMVSDEESSCTECSVEVLENGNLVVNCSGNNGPVSFNGDLLGHQGVSFLWHPKSGATW